MKICFVLEGGALRGLYTAGVLDYLFEKNINIDCIIGVSAGALFGVNYFSKQPGRVLRYNLKYCNDKRYMSLKSLILTGNIVNKSFAYYKVTKKLDPFDEESFEKTNKDFYSVVTNLENGEAEYIKIEKPIFQLEELRASSSMPFYSRIVKLGNNRYLDGAVADSIPVKKALEMKYDRVVVILTQPIDYRKKELTDKEINKIKKKYKKYPLFIDQLLSRPKRYNKLLDDIKELEKDNKVFVFRPSNNVEINPLKKNIDDLRRVYNIGISDAMDNYEQLVNYLK